MSSSTFPVQPKLFVTLASTDSASGFFSDLVNRCVGPQTFQQLFHAKRTVMTAFAKQANVMLVYEMQLDHSIR
jgi:hypothetical protein